ncbi:TonB-dependent receptor [Sphingomonas sp. So64.6b]|uniref:TonB-dependent receptor n=1 Tax=Sphingomonas sp. So64.6b TaxID=2997354 RepID=UPI001600BAA6|nr:TonB-dependent receptor [Sphingomonas sp. So64.6b]QNA84329.1 TonB-dependent receptor [Sphingomonas sp. So64.6b]
MRGFLIGMAACGILAGAMPAFAQDDGASEIVVTGMRRLNPDDDNDRIKEIVIVTPAAIQTLRRTADFAVQQVVVISDTEDEDQRHVEIQTMTRKAIDLADKAGVLVASGEVVVEPLTAANYKDLAIVEDKEDNEGDLVKFLVKVPLAPGIDAKAVLARIDKFIKLVPAVGRAEMKAYSELTLSVVNPEQYRGAIIDLVAKDTAATSTRFGTGYGVEVTGLDRPVQWKRAGLTEVQLFLPSAATVRPRD